MADEYQAWDIAQNFKTFGIYLLEDSVESFAQHIWLNYLIIVVDWQDLFPESGVEPENFCFAIAIFVQLST